MGTTLKYKPESRSARPDFNYQMCILSVIGIIFVMLGHLKNDFSSTGTVYGWFPYYSFHMPLFFFISGYFFRDSCDDGFARKFPSFLWKKIKSLLIPYYVINGCFLLIQTVLRDCGIFYGMTFSLKEWLLQPWIRVEPYTFSHPTWFLMALFLSEIFFLLIRKVFSLFIRKPLLKETVLFVFTVLCAVAVVTVIDSYGLTGAEVVYLRSVYFLVFLQLGSLYRKYLEKKDVSPWWIYFLILFAIQFVIILYTENSPLYYSYVKMQFFGKRGLVALITAIIGIAFWLRVSRIISWIPKRSRFVMFMGDSTKYIMAFHLFGFFLLNCYFNTIYMIPEMEPYLGDFNQDLFMKETYYVCNSNPRVVVLYFFAMVG